MSAEQVLVGARECKTGVRRVVKMGQGFNTGRDVTFRYQARIHPPLTKVGRRKGRWNAPKELTLILDFLRTYNKHFPTARVISAQSWGVTVGSRAVRTSSTL